MTRSVVPFKVWHIEWLNEDVSARANVTPQALEILERENSWTAVVDGDVIACAGTVQQWAGRCQAWAYLRKGIAPHMTWITEQVMEQLSKIEGRIEMTVRADFKPGFRWAKRLGFVVESPLLRKFGPYGEDHVGYVRIN